ncbi:GNAT family N-acetyltransferase [Fulvimarina endophytica]|uniref:GNAT family N-acetyltransferase n=1 Tax=Fulvimarina endophytica TaxID=2293836 RepID=A0A371WYT1_9HYPH|nr:GNAT family N-acetyltransferase [Fulvimarina endophytica]
MTGDAILPVLGDVARLRMTVFRAFPYLYDGDPAYEQAYMEAYAQSEGAVVVVARAPGGAIVGTSTGAPLADHEPQLSDAFAANGIDPGEVYYCAESVLLPGWRGHGVGHRFFDEREAAAREQGFSIAAFCAVERPEDHPKRPEDYEPLDGFWTKRGYGTVDEIKAVMAWRDVGEAEETEKRMQFWMRRLDEA